MSFYIDPHIHMISRDHRRLPAHGLRAAASPSASRPSGPGSTAAPPRASTTTSATSPRSSRSGPPSSASATTRWLCINAKEAENVSLSREVIALIPEFLDKPNVLGIGEIGLNKNTAQRGDHLPGARRSGDEDQRADPHPHAAPGGQVQGHADDHRHAQERPPRQAGARLHRPRRGAHRPARPRQRLLVRHDALPDDEVHAGAGRATSSRWSAPTASWRTRPATGASPTRWRCRS